MPLQNMQDDMEDLMEQANEVQEIMGRSYGMPEIDDDELEAELDALGDEIGLDEDATYLDDAIGAPSAPTSEPGDSMRVSMDDFVVVTAVLRGREWGSVWKITQFVVTFEA